MCRHAAWFGPARPLSWLISEPEHGLLEQSYAPRMQRYGTVNADGFGMGWYDPVLCEPVRYRRTVPIWSDANLSGLAAAARSTCLIAAVRCATVGMPVEETATAPFADGRWLLSHNGRVERDAVRRLAGGRESLCEPESLCDSAWLASLVFTRLRAGASLADALTLVVKRVAAADPAARLNLLACGGAEAAAIAWGDSLYAHVGEGVLVASEPLDDRPGWRPVPDRNLLSASPDGVLVAPIR
ncbi:ergothioneine biosynthesis protein EgtC [Sphaerimonospora cavernae]|uniref:Gamma-glutamyl-hercynylcysteine sulfoxide hydrolase n=1 Tax=Sphaerimonospora cavernae TaxID=1740611 RepID=A0ABV6U4B4_9ACTN